MYGCFVWVAEDWKAGSVVVKPFSSPLAIEVCTYEYIMVHGTWYIRYNSHLTSLHAVVKQPRKTGFGKMGRAVAGWGEEAQGVTGGVGWEGKRRRGGGQPGPATLGLHTGRPM